MDISINAKVNCFDGPCGLITRVILKPTPEEITHLVVEDGSFPETETMVSIDHVVETTLERIPLNCSRAELSEMPIFDRVEFVPSSLPRPTHNGSSMPKRMPARPLLDC